jgi:hypothetical protein
LAAVELVVSQATNIRDLEDGTAVDQVLLVRDTEVRQTRNGSDFMRLEPPRADCRAQSRRFPPVAACQLLSEIVPPAA